MSAQLTVLSPSQCPAHRPLEGNVDRLTTMPRFPVTVCSALKGSRSQTSVREHNGSSKCRLIQMQTISCFYRMKLQPKILNQWCYSHSPFIDSFLVCINISLVFAAYISRKMCHKWRILENKRSEFETMGDYTLLDWLSQESGTLLFFGNSD